MNNKTIIFDADGTLIDSLWVWDNLVLNFLQEKQLNIEPNLHDKLWSMSFNEGIYYIKEKYNLDESFDQINSILLSRLQNAYQNEVSIFDNVVHILKELKNKEYFLIVASASDKKLLKLCFLKHDILKYFDYVITERDLNISKTNHLFFTKLLKDFNLDSCNTILIDDSIFAIKSANKAHIKTIGILNGTNKEIFENVCDLTVNSIGDLNEKSINNCWK